MHNNIYNISLNNGKKIRKDKMKTPKIVFGNMYKLFSEFFFWCFRFHLFLFLKRFVKRYRNEFCCFQNRKFIFKTATKQPLSVLR